jgi:hypothetical protein
MYNVIFEGIANRFFTNDGPTFRSNHGGRSCKVIAEGGVALLDDLKRKAVGIVRVLTDDTEINLAHLLSNVGNRVKVLVQCPTRHDLNDQQIGRRIKTQVLEIPKSRIRSMSLVG